ncbi:MAG: type I-D CRISPR-associated protein Cas5/Csc1 [Chloroflexus sp.]|nr:type I-D CRISPR-associated protein Cas5/Csc1 [Chloroflexus sp.]
MTTIYRCQLTLHESLFFATREIGRLYETGRYLHNYALAYALGFVATPWFNREQVPNYSADLATLRDRIYVTPAEPKEVDFQLATFKYGEEVLHVEMAQATRNTPSFGRAKELSAGSIFQFYVISQEPVRIPRWIRLGKWHSKAMVTSDEVQPVREEDGFYRAACPLNPLDLPEDVLVAFDIVTMPPASLVANARCQGRHYRLGEGTGLPISMAFGRSGQQKRR